MENRFLPGVVTFPDDKQNEMDELLDKNSEGQITPVEKVRLSELVREAELLTVENAKRLFEQFKNEKQDGS